MKKNATLALMGCVFICAGPESMAAGETATGAAGLPWSILTMPEAETLVAAVLSLLAALAVRWCWIRKWRLERAVQCVAAGVRETYEEYVRAIKQGAEDGKLTAGEREFAMRLALDKAKQYALNEGIDLLKIYAREYLPVLADKIIGERKASTRR